MEFFEVPLFDDDLFKLLVRFAINVFFLSLIVTFAIYPMQREREFAFTAVMMNVIVFFICFSLKKLDLGLGMALGLFAIFGVLRYRTDSIRVKEMTYLFIVIGLAVINSLSNKQTSYAELATVNLIIFATALLKEKVVGNGKVGAKKNGGKTKPVRDPAQPKANKVSMDYDKLERLGNQDRMMLIDDLKTRTGLNVTSVQIKNIDLIQNRATLAVTYLDPPLVDPAPGDDRAS